MQLFRCESCGQRVYFENTQCTQCGTTLGFDPDSFNMAAIKPLSNGYWQPVAPGLHQSDHYRQCNNYATHGVCNWLVPATSEYQFCVACRLNETIPDLSIASNKTLWARLETEKRRLVYSLLKLGLPLSPKVDGEDGLAFRFLADTAAQFNESGRVLTGHKNGVITLNISEADPVTREAMRSQMAEPYRTILGHFRHESGHYYWERLVWNTPWLEVFREGFGDERRDYSQSLDTLYRHGPVANWQEHHVSAYASCHPWEDWAETWAHYLHMVDTLETAYQFGLSVHPRISEGPGMSLEQHFNPYYDASIDSLVEHWLPLTYALNSLNRSMGHDDLYPFVLSPGAIAKLGMVHNVIHYATGHSSQF
jgi:hypothetical protein